MAEKPPSKADQVAALRLARANRKSNPFEDAARGREPLPEGVTMWPPIPIAVTSRILAPAATIKRGRPLAKDAHKTLSKTKPWEAEGMSKATWYRRKKGKPK